MSKPQLFIFCENPIYMRSSVSMISSEQMRQRMDYGLGVKYCDAPIVKVQPVIHDNKVRIFFAVRESYLNQQMDMYATKSKKPKFPDFPKKFKAKVYVDSIQYISSVRLCILKIISDCEMLMEKTEYGYSYISCDKCILRYFPEISSEGIFQIQTYAYVNFSFGAHCDIYPPFNINHGVLIYYISAKHVNKRNGDCKNSIGDQSTDSIY